MAQDQSNGRKTRQAAALKENLKRRKAQERAKTGINGTGEAKGLGVAPQAGLENKPEASLKSAPKRS